MDRVIAVVFAVAVLAAGCSDGSEGATSGAVPVATTVTTGASVTTTQPVTATQPVTTVVQSTSTTVGATTTSAPAANDPAVEAWWCEAIEEAKAYPWGPEEFAQSFKESFEAGFTNVPADSLEEAAEQLAAVQCDPEYGQAAASLL